MASAADSCISNRAGTKRTHATNRLAIATKYRCRGVAA